MTDAQVIAAIRKHHLKANIAKFERDPSIRRDLSWRRNSSGGVRPVKRMSAVTPAR